MIGLTLRGVGAGEMGRGGSGRASLLRWLIRICVALVLMGVVVAVVALFLLQASLGHRWMESA